MASETARLLPRASPTSAPSLSPRSTLVLMGIGVTGATAAGWAFASMFVLVARSLDLMARKTTDGADDIFQSYLRLVVIASVGKLLQYVAFSWISTCKDYTKPAKERDVSKATLERAVSILVNASCAFTGVYYSFYYGWKFTLFAFGVAAMTAIAFGLFVWWSAYREIQADGKSEELKELETKDHVAAFWDRAINYAMLNATTLVLSKLKKLFVTERREGGLFDLNPILLSVPAVLAFPYTAFKIHSDPTCVTEHCDIAVSMAVTYFAIMSCVRAHKFQVQAGSMLPSRSNQSPGAGDSDHARAIEWTAELTKPFQPSILSLIVSALVAVVAFVAWYVIGAYGVVWLFEATTSADAKLGTTDTTTVMAVVAGGIILHSVASEFWVRSLQRSGSKITEALVSELVTARMNTPVDDQAKWPVVDSEKLLENATSLGLSAAAQYSRRGWSALIGSLVCVGVAVYIDPLFAGAVLVERVLALTPSAWKALHLRGIRIPGADSWFILCVLESVLRCVARVVHLVAGLVLLYVLIQWVAQGTSTLFSSVAVQLIVTYGVDFYVLRGSPSFYFGFEYGRTGPVQFYDDDAITAAVQLKVILTGFNNESMTGVTVDTPLPPSAPLDGDLSLQLDLVDRTESIHLRPGELAVVEVKDVEEMKKITASMMRLRRASVVRADSVGSQPRSELSATRVRDRIMIVDHQPVIIPGTVRENLQFVRPSATNEEIESVATACEIGIDYLDCVGYANPMTEKNETRVPTKMTKLLLAQICLRKPDVLIVHDTFNPLSYKHDYAVVALNSIHRVLPACKVLVLSRTTALWKPKTAN